MKRFINKYRSVMIVFTLLSFASEARTQILEASDGASSDFFGSSVSISGSTVIAGAFGDDIDSNSNQGSAYVFRTVDGGSGTVTESLKFTASDGASSHNFGRSVSLSGNTAIVGAEGDEIGSNSAQGSAYVFRNVDSVSEEEVTESLKLTASDGVSGDYFGRSVSLSGNTAIAGSYGSNFSQGSAYVFRTVDSGSGTVTESLKLTASDGASSDYFGFSVSLSGSTAIAGAYGDDIGSNFSQGSAYVFRTVDSVREEEVTESLKLTASDGASGDRFGYSVSLSGNTAMVGAYGDAIDSIANQGSAYVFRNVDSGSGTVTESLKLTASDGVRGDSFGFSVAIDGDNFVVGAGQGDGVVQDSGKAYVGSVSSMTTLDEGDAKRVIAGLSFESREDWIVGETTSDNLVILSAGDEAEVVSAGKNVYIGKDPGATGNVLAIDGKIAANDIVVGADGNSYNLFYVDGEASFSNLFVAEKSTLGGGGFLMGDVTLGEGAFLLFEADNTLTLDGEIVFHDSFGIDDVLGLDNETPDGQYTLIESDTIDFSSLGLGNFGAENSFDLGEGKFAYFESGSLQLNVLTAVPEPSTVAMVFGGVASLFFLSRRRKKAQA